MRFKIFALTALAGASLVATPAVAAEASTAAGAEQPYRGYQQPYRGYDQRARGYGHGNQHFAYGKVRELQNRVARMRQDITYFGRQRAITPDEYRKLQRRGAKLQQRIDRMAYRGLNRNEYRRAIDGIRKLHQQISKELNDGRRYARHGYGYNSQRDRYWNDDNRYYNDRRWNDRRYDRRDRDDWDDDWDD
jgi:hypothetical protein